MTNDALFIDVLAQIEKHPETWDQATWGMHDCGSAYCFAGHSVVLSGHTMEQFAIETDLDIKVLGISANDGRVLFDARNALDDLYRISAELMGIDVEVLREKVAAKVADGQVQP